MPKVLQRFGGSANVNRSGVLAAQTRIPTGESKELARRLETAERTITKLRSELSDAKSTNQAEHNAVVQEAEAARQAAEQEAEDLRDRLVTVSFPRTVGNCIHLTKFLAPSALHQSEKYSLVFLPTLKTLIRLRL